MSKPCSEHLPSLVSKPWMACPGSWNTDVERAGERWLGEHFLYGLLFAFFHLINDLKESEEFAVFYMDFGSVVSIIEGEIVQTFRSSLN
ncbi:MAG: hypothetical protein JJT78_03320 [Leptospira sp.]|nr:hypothetical protein [Leptospira sp.]